MCVKFAKSHCVLFVATTKESYASYKNKMIPSLYFNLDYKNNQSEQQTATNVDLLHNISKKRQNIRINNKKLFIFQSFM